jgi:hyperosmotically inducible periplasmic protein
MRHTTVTSLTLSVLLLAGSSVSFAAPRPQQQTTPSPPRPDSELKADIQRVLAGLDMKGPRLTVEVHGGAVTVSGMVPSLWVKEDAVNRVVKAGHFASFTADITIAQAESDEALARAVGNSIRGYSRYSVFDVIQGRVRSGKVTVAGAVTEPKKLDDLLTRIAKIHGVQAIDNQLAVLPNSDSDNRLRSEIVDAIYRDQVFENYSLSDPPIHVIVDNGHVTLVGAVRTELERRKAESATRAVFGVLAFENKVQITGGQNSDR